MKPITIGAPAPDFELKDQDGSLQSLAMQRGKNVLLSFHPLAWTSVCQRQMESLEMNADTFRKLNTVAFGVSVDSAPCKKAWAASMNVTRTRLLADFWPHGRLAERLGLFRQEQGTSERVNVVIDQEGVVRWLRIYPIGEVPDLGPVIEVLRGLHEG